MIFLFGFTPDRGGAFSSGLSNGLRQCFASEPSLLQTCSKIANDPNIASGLRKDLSFDFLHWFGESTLACGPVGPRHDQ